MDEKRKDELEPQLYALSQLKQEYGIGSQQAFTFLKIQEEYRNLQTGLFTRLPAESRPTIRQISNLCSRTGGILGWLFSDISQMYLKINNHDRARNDHFIAPYGTPADEASAGPDPASGAYVRWNFDYETFLQTFYRQYSQSGDSNQAFNDSIRIDIDIPLLTSAHDGEKYTLRQILTHDADEKIYSSAEFYYEENQLELFAEASSNLHNAKVAGICKAYSYKDLDLEDVTTEEFCLLMGGNDRLYKRAKNDRTLHHLWTERRIALNSVVGWNAHGLNDPIQDYLGYLSRGIKLNRERLKSLTDMGAPDEVIDGSHELLKEKEYINLAVRRNIKWLKNMLPR